MDEVTLRSDRQTRIRIALPDDVGRLEHVPLIKMTSSLVIRRAGAGDAAVIARHRVAMFSDMGSVPTLPLADALLELSTSALVAALGNESYVGWLALEGHNQVVARAR